MDNDSFLKEFQDTEVEGEKRKKVDKPSLPSPKRGRKPLWREYVEVIFLSLAAAMILRIFIVSAYRVESVSMEDALYEGDYIFINKLAYKFGEPENGDIVIFKSPLDPSKDYIKRIIATPGQTVEIIDKVIYIDNQLGKIYPTSKNVDSKILAAQLSVRDNFGPVEVPEGQYFVLGDNRDISQDSRFWGFVPRDNIRGRAMMVYWSWEPDTNSPQWSFPYIHSLFQFTYYFFVNFPSRTNWDRLFITL